MSDDMILNGPTDPHGFGREVPPTTDGDGFTIGFVEEIHGEAGRPQPEYVPTRHELSILAEHWARKVRGIESWWEESDSVGSDEMRERLYALDRLDSIADLIGEDKVRAVFDQLDAGQA
jgi:hypothetical protein